MLTLQTLKNLQARTGVKSLTENKPDYWLLALLAVLLIFGTVMIYSASFVTAAASGDHNGASVLFRHLLWLVVGLVGMYITVQIDYHRWRKFSTWAMLGVMALLLLILVLPENFAPTRFGAKRWIVFSETSSWQFQPSEFAKLILIVYAAHWLTSKGERVRNLMYGTAPFAITVGAIIALVMGEPDMGTSLVIGAIGLSMFFIAGANLVHLLSGFALAGVAFGALAVTAAYRLDRLKAYMDPLSDPTGPTWHTYQALISLGSGGVFGVGLGASRSKFFWLPTVYTDSIFAVIGEELGLIGTSLVVILFLALAWRGFSIARHAPDPFGRLIATGVTVYIVFQALLNMAVVSNLVPFTGIPLPFISYGGSSLAISMVAIGLLLNVSRQQVDNPQVLEMEMQREAERQYRDLLREQRDAERQKKEALARLQEKDKAEREARDLETARREWEAKRARQAAEQEWRNQHEQEMARQKAKEQARAEQVVIEAKTARLPDVATKPFTDFQPEEKEPGEGLKLRKPRRDWAKVYSNLARRADGDK